MPSVAQLQDSPEGRDEALQWATWMRQQWAAHGMAELKQQRNLMTDVRGAIKTQLGEDHLALESMNFTVAEWTMINTPIADQVALCPTEGLSAEQINQKYSQAVATACDRHFSNLVPHRDGRDNLFTHLFRSVYAAIATHWYAPPTVDANEYKAAIQGHYAILETTDSTLKRSLAASRHYNDYKIGDRTGNIDGRQGIKLGYGGVEVIDVFNKSRQSTTFQLEVTPSLVDQQSDDLEVTAMDTIQEVSQQVIESVSEALQALPEIEKKEPLEDSVVSKRRQPRRVKPVAVDLELLKMVASRFDIEIRSGKGQGYDHALSKLLLLLVVCQVLVDGLQIPKIAI